SSPSPSWALRLRRPRATSKGRSSARPRAMTCLTRPVARSQTSTTIAIAGSVRTRAGSVAQGPGRIQNASSSHRYQVGRTVGPLAATRAVSGWARKASTSKGGRVTRRMLRYLPALAQTTPTLPQPQEHRPRRWAGQGDQARARVPHGHALADTWAGLRSFAE